MARGLWTCRPARRPSGDCRVGRRDSQSRLGRHDWQSRLGRHGSSSRLGRSDSQSRLGRRPGRASTAESRLRDDPPPRAPTSAVLPASEPRRLGSRHRDVPRRPLIRLSSSLATRAPLSATRRPRGRLGCVRAPAAPERREWHGAYLTSVPRRAGWAAAHGGADLRPAPCRRGSNLPPAPRRRRALHPRVSRAPPSA